MTFVLPLAHGRAPLNATPMTVAPDGPLARVGALVMGILNLTPDSFSDGGQLVTVDDVLRCAEQMLEDGAAMLDLGGESTRPRGTAYGAGAAAVDVDEEIRRVVPAVEAIVQRFPEAILSVDTYKPAVARAALEAGAHLVNDVTGLRLFPEMAAVCAAAGASVVAMHSTGVSGQMPHVAPASDIVQTVGDALEAAVAAAEAAGVPGVAVDPGFGFGKTPDDNLRLIQATRSFVERFRRPVVVAVSRKATVGIVVGSSDAPAPVDERLFGSVGLALAAVAGGASIVRTHDVRPTVEALRAFAAGWGG